MSVPLLELAGLRRTFVQGEARLEVLRGVDLALERGTMAALIGPSGSGKSTLLHVAGLLERPNAGTVAIDGVRTAKLSERERTGLRRDKIGFVYQFHHLMGDFQAVENVMLPQLLAGKSMVAARQHARDLLTSLGLAERLDHRPARLSGGEQQRVAIARAMANGPSLLLADEPTGNLDPATAGDVFEILVRLVRDSGAAALIATHNHELATRMDLSFRISGGQIERL